MRCPGRESPPRSAGGLWAPNTAPSLETRALGALPDPGVRDDRVARLVDHVDELSLAMAIEGPLLAAFGDVDRAVHRLGLRHQGEAPSRPAAARDLDGDRGGPLAGLGGRRLERHQDSALRSRPCGCGTAKAGDNEQWQADGEGSHRSLPFYQEWMSFGLGRGGSGPRRLELRHDFGCSRIAPRMLPRSLRDDRSAGPGPQPGEFLLAIEDVEGVRVTAVVAERPVVRNAGRGRGGPRDRGCCDLRLPRRKLRSEDRARTDKQAEADENERAYGPCSPCGVPFGAGEGRLQR